MGMMILVLIIPYQLTTNNIICKTKKLWLNAILETTTNGYFLVVPYCVSAEKRGEVVALLDTGLLLLALFLLLQCLETLIRCLLEVGDGVCVNSIHDNNTVRPLGPKVLHYNYTLIISVHCLCWWVVWWRGPRQWVPSALYDTTWVNEGVVTHVCGNKGLAGQVLHPVSHIIMLRCDEAALFLVLGIRDGNTRHATIYVMGQVCRIDAVLEEYGVPPFFLPKLRHIDGVGRNW